MAGDVKLSLVLKNYFSLFVSSIFCSFFQKGGSPPSLTSEDEDENNEHSQVPPRFEIPPNLTEESEIKDFHDAMETIGLMMTPEQYQGVIRDYVRTTVFRKLKFVLGDGDLKFGGKLCLYMLSGLKIAQSNARYWWTTNRHIVRKCIAHKRTGVSNAIKSVFLREYSIFLIFLFSYTI